MRKEKEKLSKGVGSLEDKIRELKDIIQVRLRNKLIE